MEKFSVAIVSEQRHRYTMEDMHRVARNFAGKENCVFVGVFDGHGGREVAEGLALNMPGFMEGEIISGKSPQEAHQFAYARASQSEWAKRIIGGSCAATLFAQDDTLTTANVGDCRIIVLGESAVQLTEDHDAKNKNEVKRIMNHGASFRDYYIEHKGKLLAVTRAIGDLYFKDAGILPLPFINSYTFSQTDRFIVAASDGLFEKTSNNRVLEISRDTKDASELAQALKQEVESRDGSDNLTIIVVQINKF